MNNNPEKLLELALKAGAALPTSLLSPPLRENHTRNQIDTKLIVESFSVVG